MRRFCLVALLLGTIALSACSSQAAVPLDTTQPEPSAGATVSTPASSAQTAPNRAPAPTSTPRPAFRSPLTGLPIDKAEDLSRRPLLVKLGNSEAERPQAGLALADVVYESVTEGGITRYAAVFQSHEVANLGPVRSARLSDLQIAPEFKAVLAHVGASNPIMSLLRGGTVLDLDQFFYQQYYHRTSDRVAPYNVYTSTADLRRGFADRGFTPSAPIAPSLFDEEPPAGTPAGTVDFEFAPETPVQYVYDVARHAYWQMEYDVPTTDASTGQPVPIANLIVQFAPVQATDIVEDRNGTHSLEYDLVGSGKVLLFRDGLQVEATWRRNSLSDRTTFVDPAGNGIPLARGSVWIAVVKPQTMVHVRGQ